ncbi:hypothetical protein F6R98_00430 [Candidatus Methylospira mobilis]|uniref:Type VI lipoprotein IgE-like C-terminal domain-containing protein n=1 Tax=Candidatus Methylospira mobilis TaxID=1808979 RepID=A0A5Q0BGF4_9GAMM|nr:hypothetical protein [Candidatus Methylospira mobilis]QFY41267.1 hypothetical protein F6R98_00430 [Candidatus Methylospira mobilis]WNV05511.1 hypothetical protein RP726_03615 [Candidatus Methylospira mobilis]
MLKKSNLKWTAQLCAIVLLAACAGAGSPTPPPPFTLDVSAEYQANGGHLFYFLARAVNEKQFLLDNYQDVAAKVFASPADASVLGVFSMTPGERRQFSVHPPAQGDLALYFLFNEPGTQWKKQLSTPLKNKYSVSIGADNQIKIVEDCLFCKVNDLFGMFSKSQPE